MSSWRERLTGRNPSWLDQSLRCLLRLGCPLYLGVVIFRNWLFDRGFKRTFRCSIPVISIGNLSVGGTGKTPAVAWLVQWLQRQGLRVVLLSRGYGRLADGCNDEALELELKIPGVPHFQHWDRVASAQRAIQEFNAQVLVLDDGFQHRRLARDLEIVLVDATDSPAAQWLLPAGLRREPFSSIRRAHVVLITRTDQVDSATANQIAESIVKYNPQAVCIRTAHQAHSLFSYPDQYQPLERLRGTRVFAFCGIGNPKAFFDTLEKQDAIIVGRRAWPDHHAYTRQDLQRLADISQQYPDSALICTMKDWVKIRLATIGSSPLWALRVDLKTLDDDSNLQKMLRSVISAKH